MNIIKKYFMLKSVLVLILAFFIALILQFIGNPTPSRWFYLLIPFCSFGVNYLAFKITIEKKSGNFTTQISALFGIKFFSYLILALIYFLIEKENSQRLIFIIYIFITYLLNTIVLLNGILKNQKSTLKSDGNIK